MHTIMLLLLLGVHVHVPPVHGLVPTGFVPPAQPVLRNTVVVLSSDADGETTQPFDASREFSKYVTPRVRVTQSAPVRLLQRVSADSSAAARRFGAFYSGVFRALPMHQLILATMLVAFGAQQAKGRAALLAGARMNHLILRGQWHRLISPIFLHHTNFHLLSNSFSLWRIGPLAEGAFGPARLILLYLLSGVGGNLAGLCFGSSRAVSVGASGAVFGMMGAVGAYALRNRAALGRNSDALMSSLSQVLILNLFIGMRPHSGIDNLGHVGGCAAGLLIGLLLTPNLSRRVPPDERYDTGMVPAWAVRVLLAATVLATVDSVRSTVRLTQLILLRAAQ